MNVSLEQAEESTATPAVFFVGIAGMGMTPLALYAHQSGCKVAGYDDSSGSATCALLNRHGICVLREPTLPAGHWLLVYSSAVKMDHPLLRQGRERGLRMIRRGVFLAELSRDKKLLAVVGSHGKTTTTGMLIHCLSRFGFDFGYVLGALFSNDSRLPAQFSKADWLVAEIDESDGTIEEFRPHLTLIVNLGWDHPDRYPTYSALLEAFRGVVARTVECVLIADQDLERYQSSLTVVPGPEIISYGKQGDYRIDAYQEAGRWRAKLDGRFQQCNLDLQVEGAFNVHNLSAALAACARLTGAVPEAPLADFAGISRRQDMLLRTDTWTVITDYAHHPEEIDALLTLCRERYPGELIAVFQPHRFSRTRQYAAAFAKVLSRADKVYLLPVYAASEAYAADGTAEAILHSGCASSALPILIDERELPLRLMKAMSAIKKQTVVFIGAGNIDRIASQWVEELKASIHE